MKKTMNNVHKTSSPPFFYNHLLKRRHLGQNMLFYLNQNHAILAYKRKVLFFWVMSFNLFTCSIWATGIPIVLFLAYFALNCFFNHTPD
jgi:hypothetical protein